MPLRLREWHMDQFGRPQGQGNDDITQAKNIEPIDSAGIVERIHTTSSIGSNLFTDIKSESSGSSIYIKLGQSEIQEALEASDARKVDGVSPQRAEHVLQQRLDELHRAVEGENHVCRDISASEKRIRHREAQLGRVAATVTAIMQKRACRQGRRREKLYRHISQHLREVKERTERKREKNWQMAKYMASLLAKEHLLGVRVNAEAHKVGIYGVMEPDEVERALESLLNREDECDSDMEDGAEGLFVV
ncbi:hypothetical protein BGZ63DRAFT_209994 [Mariannaea sp. PMI_226]|nr:hypothetical protein BGZ63DRAFT_209994 [Mariannaea sp. PMI_226]